MDTWTDGRMKHNWTDPHPSWMRLGPCPYCDVAASETVHDQMTNPDFLDQETINGN